MSTDAKDLVSKHSTDHKAYMEVQHVLDSLFAGSLTGDLTNHNAVAAILSAKQISVDLNLKKCI